MTDAIIICVLVLLLIGGGILAGDEVASHHYEAVITTIQTRDASALKAANDRVTQSKKEHDDAIIQANADVAHLAAANVAARDSFTDRLRQLEGALSRRPVPGPVGGPGSVPTGPAVPGSAQGAGAGNPVADPALAAAITRWNAALTNYIVACGKDGENLLGILDVAPKHP